MGALTSDLVRFEVDRHDWAAMRCGCGKSAGHLAAELLAFAGGSDPGSLDEHFLPAGEVLVEPSFPVLEVLLAVLSANPPASQLAEYYGQVLALVGDTAYDPSYYARGRDLVSESRATARQGLWLFYAEVLSGRDVDAAGYAFEILELVEEDESRVEQLRAAAGERLPQHLRTKLGTD
ncbi:hypothetical protein SAMN04488564_103641 [Lentzea waywayandensis]|uniref:Tetratricopeptide repeat-containing protein n=1 Tax=Lentzea waywayandensis TaxID=84724 RepID=A0A1I6E1W1_9PSEU|nr:hypothetical protein [Lentzea waywayandensis]SFR11730.1 hypothetical protein SAMN04488564_103641 [Lentzea waywayandensis]